VNALGPMNALGPVAKALSSCEDAMGGLPPRIDHRRGPSMEDASLVPLEAVNNRFQRRQVGNRGPASDRKHVRTPEAC